MLGMEFTPCTLEHRVMLFMSGIHDDLEKILITMPAAAPR